MGLDPTPLGLKRLFLDFDGRIGRGPFWLGMAVLGVLALVGDRLALAAGGSWGAAAFSLALTYPGLAVAAKRCHDRGRSEIVLLAVFAPALLASAGQLWLGTGADPGYVMSVLGAWLIGALIWAAIDLGLLPGEAGPNRFGEAP